MKLVHTFTLLLGNIKVLPNVNHKATLWQGITSLLWHGTHLCQTLFHGYVLFISIFLPNHSLYHSWIMSLSLLVTIKCLRNGFLTRIVSFYFSDVTQKLNITYVYTMVTSLYTMTPLQTTAFLKHTITSYCPHTGDLFLSSSQLTSCTFSHKPYIYLFTGNVCSFPHNKWLSSFWCIHM